MSQSNVIFAAIFIAYLVFITMRGELPVYAGLLLKSAPAQNASSNSSSSDTTGTVAKVAATAAEYWWLA